MSICPKTVLIAATPQEALGTTATQRWDNCHTSKRTRPKTSAPASARARQQRIQPPAARITPIPDAAGSHCLQGQSSPGLSHHGRHGSLSQAPIHSHQHRYHNDQRQWTAIHPRRHQLRRVTVTGHPAHLESPQRLRHPQPVRRTVRRMTVRLRKVTQDKKSNPNKMLT